MPWFRSWPNHGATRFCKSFSCIRLVFATQHIKQKNMNMMEAFGATCPPIEPLIAIAKPRLPP
jgi:hypothetical protein